MKKIIIILFLGCVSNSCQKAYELNDWYNKRFFNRFEGNVEIKSITLVEDSTSKIDAIKTFEINFLECTTNATRIKKFVPKKNNSFACLAIAKINNNEYFMNFSQKYKDKERKTDYVKFELEKFNLKGPIVNDNNFETYKNILDGEYFIEKETKKQLILVQTLNVSKNKKIKIIGKYK